MCIAARLDGYTQAQRCAKQAHGLHAYTRSFQAWNRLQLPGKATEIAFVSAPDVGHEAAHLSDEH